MPIPEQLKVGVLIPTMNRADFIIRQLNYYASVHSPHPIYIADSGGQEDREKMEVAVQKLKSKIEVTYFHLEPCSGKEAFYFLTQKAKEKYVVYSGDDDFQVPDSLTKCAEFLESNSDYVSAGGLALSIRVVGDGPYGQLRRVTDYQRPEYTQEKVSDRLADFLNRYSVMIFSVIRRDTLEHAYSISVPIKDKILSAEILPCAWPLTRGKSKTLDCLSFVRQIHVTHTPLPDTPDWILGQEWNESYKTTSAHLAQAVSELDKLNLKDSENIIKKAFFIYIKNQLNWDRASTFVSKPKISHTLAKKIKYAIPSFIKPFYRKIRPFLSDQRHLHYEVTQTSSPYYSDFQAILKSLTETVDDTR